MTRLIIARHGNTFEEHEEPRRVGIGTDISLTETGITQARAIGQYLKEHGMLPDAAFSSYLARAYETADIAMIAAGLRLHIQEEGFLNEIDYGPDENQLESTVVKRVGENALRDWDERYVAPPGWLVDTEIISAAWVTFAERIHRDYNGCTVLTVTSNGIARFAKAILKDAPDMSWKLRTGAFGVMSHDGNEWTLDSWGIRPSDTES